MSQSKCIHYAGGRCSSRYCLHQDETDRAVCKVAGDLAPEPSPTPNPRPFVKKANQPRKGQ